MVIFSFVTILHALHISECLDEKFVPKGDDETTDEDKSKDKKKKKKKAKKSKFTLDVRETDLYLCKQVGSRPADE